MTNRIADWTSRYGSRFSAGFAASLVAVQIAVTWILTCGSSSLSLATLLFAAGVGVLGAAFAFDRLPAKSWYVPLVSGVSLIAVSCCFAWSLNSLLGLSASFAGANGRFSAFLLPGIAVAIQSFLLHLWLRPSRLASPAVGWQPSTLIGIAAGLLVPVWCGIFVLPMAAFVVVSLIVATALVVFNSTAFDVNSEDVQTDSPEKLPFAARTSQWFAIAAVAVAVHAGIRIASVLMPMSPVVILVAASLVFAMLALSFLPLVSKRFSAKLVVIPVAALCLVPLCFDMLVDSNLSMNANISSAALLILLRALQLAAIWAGAMLAWRCLVPAETGGNFTSASIVVALATMGVSFLLAANGLTTDWQWALSISLCAASVLVTKSSSVAERRGRLAIIGAAMAALLIALIAPINHAEATHLLFSARSAQGHRMGLKRDIIVQSHCTRLLEDHNCDGDHLTVWRSAGDQILLRRNGFPIGQVTANSLTTPQPIPETLTTVLPLIMHPRAQSILLLGDDSGAGLRVCTQFPVHTIEAIRTDESTTDVARRYSWKTAKSAPEDDDRVTVRNQDISVAVRTPRTSEELFDVVVAASPNPVSMRCQDQLTTEFYQAVRSQLTGDGVFCQRVVQHDLGSEPLVRIISSMRRVFGRVVVTQMALGQIAVIAAVDPDGLLDKGLLNRLKKNHVTRQLSRSGWDWSQVAALPIVDTNDPVGIFEHVPMLASTTTGNAHFAFALPLEATRWGNKAGEVQQMFAPHQQRMADAAPKSNAYHEFARRYSAVIQQSEILTSFPDNPWPYRKSLKMELQRNPGEPVKTFENGEVVQRGDELDEYRKSYFETLGMILGQAKDGMVDPLTLRNFNAFTDRYEPLLSHFARHELIRIHEAAGHPSPAMELCHRLNTIYFSEGGDTSIRLINHTLTQMLDDPELLDSDEARYDHVNSLLQELVRRWEVRVGYSPSSASRTQQDVDDCVRLANRSLDALEKWAPNLAIAKDDLRSRRRFINQALISPLRTYQDQVIAHRMKHAQPETDDVDKTAESYLPMLSDPSTLLTN